MALEQLAHKVVKVPVDLKVAVVQPDLKVAVVLKVLPVQLALKVAVVLKVPAVLKE